MEEAPKKAWGWITHHTGIVLAGVVASVVAWFLIIRPASQSSQAQPQQVSYPGTGTPPGGVAPGAPTTPPTTTPTLPYNVDWTILNSIKGKLLKSLTTQELSIETQINDATLQGNTALIAQLQAQLQQLQQRISQFQPPGKGTGRGGPTTGPRFVENSIDFFRKWVSISPGATTAEIAQAWAQTWRGYQNVPGFTAFEQAQLQRFLQGPGGNGQPGTWNIQQFERSFAQAYRQQFGTRLPIQREGKLPIGVSRGTRVVA